MMTAMLLALAASPRACTVAPPPPIVCIRAGTLPHGLERWNDVPLVSPGALTPGKAASIALLQSTGAPSCDGSGTLTVTQDGTYAVAMSAGGWIDLVGSSGSVPSIAHAHGEACSGVAKVVDFALAPGRYGVKIGKAAGPSVKLMVIRR